VHADAGDVVSALAEAVKSNTLVCARVKRCCIFRKGWVVVVATQTVGLAMAELFLRALPATAAMDGVAMARTVLASTGLMLVLRGYQRQIEVLRVRQP